MSWRQFAEKTMEDWGPVTVAQMIDRGWLEIWPPEITRAGKAFFRSQGQGE